MIGAANLVAAPYFVDTKHTNQSILMYKLPMCGSIIHTASTTYWKFTICLQLCMSMMQYLHETNVVLNAWKGLPWEGVQGGDLWPVKLLSQHQHDLQVITILKKRKEKKRLRLSTSI